MAEIEGTYAASVTKLLKSTSYTFHSNVLTQWMGNEPFEELGTLKTGWQKLGNELSRLTAHHEEKANGYSSELRQPLIDLLPRLETMKKTVRTRGKDLIHHLDLAQRKHKTEKLHYAKCGDRYERLQNHLDPTSTPKSNKQQEELRVASTSLMHQEALYEGAVHDLGVAQKSFDKEWAQLFADAERFELERLNALGKSLQDFAKLLSNTVPSYLECMQRIVFSVSDINGQSDVSSFVNAHSNLMTTEVALVEFEPHRCRKQVHSNRHSQTKGSHDNASNPQIKCTSRKSAHMHKTEESMSKEDLVAVEDHFDNAVSDTSTGQATGTAATAVTTVTKETAPSVVRKFTKKFKFWSKQATTGGDESHTEDDPNLQPHNLNDEIEAILSTSKKTGQEKQSREEDQHSETDVVAEKLATAKGSGDHHSKEPSSPPAVVSVPPVMKRKPTVAVKPKVASKPFAHIAPLQQVTQPVTKEVTQLVTKEVNKLETLLQQLEQTAAHNDYYQVLGVSPTAGAEEIARQRRERSKQLHPDHYKANTAQHTRAEEELVRVNQIYTDVMSKQKSRDLYDHLCKFRKFYKEILVQKQERLLTAKDRMGDLKDSLHKAKTPLPLQEEVELALKLIQLCLEKGTNR